MDSNLLSPFGSLGQKGTRLRQNDQIKRPSTTTKPGPKRLTQILSRLGPTFIKIGQFLSLRPDLLPQEYCDELLRLVDRAPAISWEAVSSVLKAELGDDPRKIFRHIRSRPLAAGSIAQVHLAKTHDGKTVAVKIQRPNLPAQITRDLRKIRWLARFIKVSGIGPLTSTDELVEELQSWLQQELDFKRELSNCTRMYEEMPREHGVRIPQPFPEFSSRRVITTEYLPGIPFSEIIRLARAGEHERIRRTGIDPDSLATGLIESSLYQIFRMRFFHADLHPGNLIAMNGNVIGLVDFGLTDVLDPGVEKWQAEYLRSLYEGDVHGMYRSLSQIFVAGLNTVLESWRQDFFTITNRWLVEIETERDDDETRSPTAGYMVVLLQLARRHDMRLPRAALSMYRTLLTSESVAYQLQSRANLRDTGRSFFESLEIERVIEDFTPRTVVAWAMQINELVRYAPASIQQLLSDVSEGRFILSVRSADSEHDRRLANQRARLLVLAIVSVALTLMLVTSGQSIALGRPITWLLPLALTGIYLWMALIWRKLK